MNAPIKVAQVSSNQGTAPVHVIKLEKPGDGQAVTVKTGYEGKVRIDFSGIADERISIVRVGETAVIYFHGNKSTITLDPFFGSNQWPLAHLEFELGPNRIFGAQDVAALLPFTVYQGILPAADGQSGNEQDSGANFLPANVADLPPIILNELMPPETLGPIDFTADIGPAFDDRLPIQSGLSVGGIVEEEHLVILRHESPTQLSDGNEDETSSPDADDNPDTFDGDDDTPTDDNVTTITFTGNTANGQSLNKLISGGNPPFTFSFNNVTGQEVKNTFGVALNSQGDPIFFHKVDDNTLIGFADEDGNGTFDGGINDNNEYGDGPDRIVFVVKLDQVEQGAWEIEIYDQFDHQPDGNVESILGLNLTPALHAVDNDGDPLDFLGTVFSVGVIDDKPILTGQEKCETVDEDDIKNNQSIGTSPNDGDADGSETGNPPSNVFGPAFVSGTLAGTVKIGADEFPVAQEQYNSNNPLFKFDSTQLNHLTSLGLKSKGALLGYSIVDTDPNDGFQILRATADGRTVFELKLFSDGDYEFSLIDQLDHDAPNDNTVDGVSNFPGSDENFDLQDALPGDVTGIDFGSVIKAEDFDGDFVHLDGVLEIKIRDDVPEIKCGNEICLVINEDDIKTTNDGIPGGSLGTSPNDGDNDGSFTGNPLGSGSGPAFVSGSLGGSNGVVQSGTDEPLKFAFVDEHLVETGLSLLGLKSKGELIKFDIKTVGPDQVLYAYVGGGDYSADDRLVFRFKLEPDGDFEFELFDQMDHDAPNDTVFDNISTSPGSDENFDLQEWIPFVDVDSLDFGLLIKATDFDGDKVILAKQLLIKIKDDVPEVKCDEKVWGVVEEEHLPQGNEDFDADPDLDEDHSEPGPDHVHHTTTVVSGTGSNSLASLIEVGTDEDGKFTFKKTSDLVGDQVETTSGAGVKSDGFDVKIHSIQNGSDAEGQYQILTARSTDGRNIFTLKVYADGDWTFTLLDQIDHHLPQQADNEEDYLALDFSELLQFTDFDNDTVPLDNAEFYVKVIDDIPTLKHLQTTGKEVQHDETPGIDTGSGDDDVDYDTLPAAIQTAFNGVGFPGSDPDVSPKDGPVGNLHAIGYAKSEGSMVSFQASVGADQPGKIELSLKVSNGSHSGLQTTDGRSIYLFNENGVIVGRYDKPNDGDDDVNGPNSNDPDPAAFAIMVDQNGVVYVVQYVSLKHPDDDSHDESIDIADGKIKLEVKVTDEDGDWIKDDIDISSKINFDDDGPKVNSVFTSGTIIHDETYGDDGDHDVNTNLSALFASVTNKGNDPHVTPGDTTDPIGYAQSNAGFLLVSAIFGSDGPHPSQDYKYELVIGSNTTTLQTTEGRNIELFMQNGVIVGRYEVGGDNNPDGQGNFSNEPAAFAIHIDQNTGVISLVQYVSLKHPIFPDNHDEPVSLALNNVQVKVTAKDGDDDTDSKTVSIGNQISFQDDGPKVTVTVGNFVKNGLFLDGFVSNSPTWGEGSGIAAGPNIGTSAWVLTGPQLERVGEVYAGVDSPTDSLIVDMEASPGNCSISQNITGLVNGQKYQISFEIGEANFGDAELEVYWNGVLVDTIEPNPGLMQVYTFEVTAGGPNLLTFTETGTQGDNTGTYLANVAIRDIIIIDETPLPDADSDDTLNPLVSGLFTGGGGVANTGTDPNMEHQYAQGAQPIASFVADFGADGPHGTNLPVYSLSIASQGVFSGLKTTEEKNINLFVEGAGGKYIVGRYDSDNDGDIDANDKAAFALTIDPVTGQLSVALYVSLEHPDTTDHDEGVYLNDGTLFVNVKVTDGDLDTATDDADISQLILFEDDGPSILPNNNQTVQRDWTLDEDVLPVTGNDALDAPADFNDYTTITDKPLGVLWGADGAKGLTFAATDANTPTITVRDKDGNPVAGPLKSGGVDLYYEIVANGDGGQTLTAYKGNGGPVVFTLTLDPDAHATGAFTFTLANELDHPDADGQNRLDLDFGFTAADGDDDTAASNITIRITDDVPYVVGSHPNLVTNGDFQDGTWSPPAWWGSIAQPGDVPGWTITGHISFPPQNGIQFERQSPGFLGLNSSTGNGLIDMGGSPGNYVLTQNVGAGAAPDLIAGQKYVLQVEVGAPFPTTALMQVWWNGQLIGTIDTNVSSGQMEKFAFIVEGTGNPATDVIQFREIGTGDADLGNAPDGQDLQTEGYHGTYIANVQMYALNGVVDEDALNNANADGIGDSQIGDVSPDTTVASGTLGVLWGSDDSDDADAGNVQDGANGAGLIGRHITFSDASVGIFGTNALKSNGDTVSFALLNHDTRLVGFVDTGAPGYDVGDRLVFEVTLLDDGSGKFVFTLHDNLDHAPGASENDIALQFNFTATDFDGDEATGSFFVGVDDDLPTVTAVAGNGLLHDETAGVQSGGPDADALADIHEEDDVADASAAFTAAGFVLPGTAIGYAQQTSAVLLAINYGADGPGSTAINLTNATGGNFTGQATNLFVTEGGRIFLYTENGVVVGREGGPGIGDANPIGAIAFALVIDATETLSLAQFMAIDHFDPASNDEAIQLRSSTNGDILFATVTATDDDGDATSATTTLHVHFDDDGPQITSITKNSGYGDELILNGSFEQGHGLLGNNWEIFASITDWEDGADGVPFEIQTGGAGGVAAKDGNALVELDADTEGNPDNPLPDINPTGNTNAIVQQTVDGTVAGQTYELTFWYHPRPNDGDDDSSSMNVLWNGVVVHSIDSTGLPDAWQQITVILTATGDPSVLGFQGAGQPNELGALIDLVSLRSISSHILDDEDTTLSPAVEIQGGPGDDGNGLVASGKIAYDAGADGLKSIVIGGIPNLSAIWVDANGVGHPESVSYHWVADGLGGGTLYGLTTHFNTPANAAFKVSVDADGNYVFTLNAPLNHPLTDNPGTDETETSWEDNLQLDFPVTITDGDDDTATGTLCINVDDDSPEFVEGGIEDATVTELGDGVDGALNLVFGADGEHVTNGIKITTWPDLPGVTETLSEDGKTLEAFIDGQPPVPLYTLVLNPNGTYTFTQHANLPGGVSILPTIATNDSYGPTPTHDYAGFTLNGVAGSLLNSSNQGVGVGNNGIADGEQLSIVFDNEMTSAVLGINHIGNGTMEIDWVAYAADGTTVVDSGTTATFNADGTITITPSGPFFSIQLTGDFVSGPNDTAVQFRITSIGGDAEGDIPLDSLTFQVTGMDGDGDAVSDTFDVEINVDTPFFSGTTFLGTVEEEDLSNFSVSATVVTGSNGNEDDGVPVDSGSDADTDVVGDWNNVTESTSGTLTISGGDGALFFSVINTVNGLPVNFAEGGQITSKGQPVHFIVGGGGLLWGVANGGGLPGVFDDATDRVVFTITLNPTTGLFTFDLNDQIDHHPSNAADNVEGIKTVDLGGVFKVDDSDAITADAHVFTDIKVQVIDDVPISAPLTRLQLFVEEDDLGFDTGDLSVGIANASGFTDEVSLPAFNLLNLFDVGADEEGTLSLNTAVSGNVKDFDGNNVTSNGAPVLWGYDSVNSVVFGYADVTAGGGFDGSDRVVFRIELTGGNFIVDLEDQIDHGVGANNDDNFALNLDASSALKFTDADGDSIVLGTNGLLIRVENDIPAVVQVASPTAIVHDESAGLQTAGVPVANVEDFNDGDVAPGSLPVGIASIFAGITANAAIGYAKGNGASFVTITPGADEPVEPNYQLDVASEAFSGLTTTDGRQIHFEQSGDQTVVGYVSDGSDVGTDEDVALAITIDPDTGEIYIAQWLAIKHTSQASGTGQPSYDEATSFNQGVVKMLVSVEDADDDHPPQMEVDLSGLIAFEDDGPTATNDGNLGSVAEGSVVFNLGPDTLLTGNDNAGADGLLGIEILIASGSLGGTINVSGGNLLYTPAANVGPLGATETFTYKLFDGDGDATTATFTVNITDSGVTNLTTSNNLLADDDDVAGAGGNAAGPNDDVPSLAGTINYALGLDTLGSIALSTTGNTTNLQTLDGQTVNTAWNAGTSQLIGYVGGDPNNAANQVFTITLSGITNSQATYTMVLLKPVEHLGTTPGDEDNTTPFTVNVTVTDSDGSLGMTAFTVAVDDDTPVATNDGNLGSVVEDQANVNLGSVAQLTGDDSFGADGQHATTPITIAQGDLGGSVQIIAGNLIYTPDENVGPGGATETFVYTIKDGDGDTTTATFTVGITDSNRIPQIISADDATVDEDGLVNANLDGAPLRTGETDSTESAADSGTFVVEYGTVAEATGSSIALLDDGALDGQLVALNGNPITFALVGGNLIGTAAGVVGTIVTIDITGSTPSGSQVTYDYTVTLHQPIKHPVNSTEDSDLLSNVQFQVTDGVGANTQTGSFDVTVWDDIPVAQNDSAEAVAGVTNFNIAFVLDFSASISNTDFDTMLNAVTDAGQQFFNNATGSVSITLVRFADGANTIGTFANFAAFEAALNISSGSRGITTGGTDYTAGIEETMDAFTPNPSAVNQVFFFSDGEPNQNEGVGHSLQAGTQADWNDFVSDNDISVQTIGVAGATEAALQDVDEADGDNDVILIADFDDLVDALLTLINGASESGNVLLGTNGVDDAGSPGGDDDGFGADGGRILSINIDGVTYTYTPGGSPAIVGLPNETDVVSKNGTSITIETPLGGNYTFHFVANGPNAAGSWTYSPGANSGPETIGYTLIDNDGDQVSATLLINVEDPNSKPDILLNNPVVNANYRDEFAAAAFNNSNGSTPWGSTPWTENSDNGNAGTGTIRMTGGQLVMGADGDSASIERTVNLLGANSATLTFNFQDNGTEDGEELTVSFAADGVNFTQVVTYDNGDADGLKTINLIGPFDSDAKIRFSVNDMSNDSEWFVVDNVNVAYTSQTLPTYSEGDAPVKVMPTATLVDPDNPANFNTGSLTVAITGGSVAGDALVFMGGGAFMVAGAVIVGGIQIGTVAGYNTTNMVITFDADATDAAVESLLQSIGFHSTSNNPGTSRQITVTFGDGGNTGAGGPLSDVEVITLNVVSVNDNPTATDNAFSVTEAQIESATSGSPINVGNIISGGTSDTDPDGGTLSVQSVALASVSLTESDAQITLDSIITQGLSGSEVARFRVRIDNSNPTLNDQDAYFSVLSNGTVNMWSDSGEDPFRGLGVGESATLNFTYTLSDGQGGTDTANVSITINGTNDAPVAVDDIVRTNMDGVTFNVPEWAFLVNDFDPDGPATLDITGQPGESGLTVSLGAGSISIDDGDNANGGSFTYTVSDGALTDDGNVVVNNIDGGGNITGTASAEILFGDATGDVFDGDGGRDVMFGGGGADVFDFNATSDSGNTIATADIIGDWSSDDTIDLSSIDANGGSPGNPAFGFGGENVNTVANSVTWYEDGGNTIVQVDTNGAAGAEMMFVLTGINHNLTSGDFNP